MQLVPLALAASASIFLAPVVSGTDADPREDLDTLIPHAISLLESKQYAKAVETLAEPDKLKKMLEREKQTLDEFAVEFGDKKAGPLLEVLKSIRGSKPVLSDDGNKATYTLTLPQFPKKEIIFVKSGKLWSLQN